MTEPFVIAGHRYDDADVVVVRLSDGAASGWGEATPTSFYGESIAGVLADARRMIAALATDTWDTLHDRFAAGAARNAVDCAVWDLRAKQAGQRAWQLAGIPAPGDIETVMTISIAAPDAMAAKAAACGHAAIKLKLGEGADDLARVRAVRAAVPGATLVVDANQAWSVETLARMMPALADLGVAMIEQPLPPEADAVLAGMPRLVPICADESCHLPADLPRLVGRYDIVNVKLDKTGGLTDAIRLVEQARAMGFGVMVGCMEGTSLAMAPATLIAGGAVVVDLDGPLLIGHDRPHGLHYEGGRVGPPDAALWG